MKSSKLIVVLGMHRSGTSAITRGLQVLGIELGDRLLPPMEDNLTGFWEDVDINALNIEMLNIIGNEWHHLASINAADVFTLHEKGYFNRAIELLQRKVNAASIFAFKDPRSTKLLPFWKEVFKHCQFNVSYILALRHPLSVAKSLAIRDKIETEQSYLLWLGHVITSLKWSDNNKRIIVDYDQLLKSPECELQRIANCLDLEINTAKLEIYKTQFLDKGLRHTIFNINDLLSDDTCPLLVREVYTILLDVASNNKNIDSEELQDKVALWSDEYEHIKSYLNQADRIFSRLRFATQALTERNEQITSLNQEISKLNQAIANLNLTASERDNQISSLNHTVAERISQINDIHNSTSWKLTAPVRFVGYTIQRIYAAYKFSVALVNAFGGIPNLLKKVVEVIRRDGIRGVLYRAKNFLRYFKNTRIPSSSIPDSNQKESENPDMNLDNQDLTISVIIPVYNTPIDMLNASIMSVREQTYQNWELIIVDDKSSDSNVAKTIQQYAEQDKRIKTCFRKENGNISNALNSGIKLATGEFITILDHDDTIDPTALYWVARSIQENPSTDYIYTDEDKVSKDGQIYYGPFYKPDWSPEYMYAMMYTCHLGVYRATILREIGGYRPEFDGAQDFDLTLRFLNKTNNVFHIPRVLYHWRVWEQSTAQSLDAKPYAEDRARKALSEFLESRHEKFIMCDGPLPGHHQVIFLPKGTPLVSIVIPTANGSININGTVENHIEAVTTSIFEKTKYSNYEIVIVHNGDLLPEQKDFFSKQQNVQLIHYAKSEFSLSEKINLGCAHANGEYLVIMNDDIRVISEDWLDQMTGMAQRNGVGVVGPKLLFPDQTIQHAGVVMLGGLPGHAYYQWPRDAEGYALSAKVNRNYLAVTGACAITPKWLFEKVGGYSDRYPLNYNDVDYSLKLHRLGYRSVYLANVELYHYEGVSKEGGRSVSDSEIQKFLEDWGETYRNDPYYNPNLSQNIPYQFG